MSYKLIQQALQKILKTTADANSYEIAWPNTSKEWQRGIMLEPSLLPGETFIQGLADDSVKDYGGIYQVTVWGDTGPGIVAVANAVDILLSAYAKGVTQDGVRVVKSWASGAVPSDTAYKVPVSIQYRFIGD